MKWDNVENLLQKYYEGETSVAEEDELKSFFKETKLLPDYLKPHAAQFTYYSHQQEQELDKFLADDWLFEKIETSQVTPVKVKSVRPAYLNYWQIAASVVLLMVAFWAGNRYQKGLIPSQDPEVMALRAEMAEMKKILATGPSVVSSASDRIRVVSQEFSPGQTDEVIDLLITTLNADPNVNVRLAACEALYRYKNEEKVREAFIQALPNQTNPLMQIALIDILVGIKEKKAVSELKKLAGKENLLPVVKSKVQQGIGTLI